MSNFAISAMEQDDPSMFLPGCASPEEIIVCACEQVWREHGKPEDAIDLPIAEVRKAIEAQTDEIHLQEALALFDMTEHPVLEFYTLDSRNYFILGNEDGNDYGPDNIGLIPPC